MDWKKLLSSERIRKSRRTDIRNEFESDFGRIIYSPALRRMHDKTQVFPLTTDDNIHSRLTHSNEVMSLGFTFGLKLSESKPFQERTGKSEAELLRIIPILLQNICLIHDIGNSPFGHFGETIISKYFEDLFNNEEYKNIFDALSEPQKRDFQNYDGNAQGLRVLTKLQILNDPFGLNLTYATLASSIKYPNSDEINSIKKKKKAKEGEVLEKEFIESKKHGIFDSEKDYFNLIVDETSLRVGGRVIRHPLCYLMEAADSIAYLCMDMEDGFNKGVYSMDFITKKFGKYKGISVCDKICTLLEESTYNNAYKIVNTRIKLIAYFVDIAFNNFIANIEAIEAGTYNKELIEDDKDNVYKIVKSFSTEIFKSREINNLESTGYSVIVGLLDFYIDFIFLKGSKNKSFSNRAIALISNSTIEAAIEETLIETCYRKLKKEKEALEADLKPFRDKGKENTELEKSLHEVEEQIEKLNPLANKYSGLLGKQKEELLSVDEGKDISNVRLEIYNSINPDFHDLDEYYKLRVIVDFISGMTDQYALKHYQKISGQRIN
ncbi:dGTP triphosphohydrolase [Elizabethkingia anophelis]|uniref:Deoxyguanosinetriphosphate triphosphohydrolase n=1 Tax=Elizabethkingia anophelis NUHP1 TaxID=1338011 RepID=A0A077ENM5_9FLAO|nr:dNTP triphosphohydrolase [Elizabethkingia anophelis]AIL47809.1 Deoxyguanosinetriphosphate triphosphohydrolase [Elizabethkingia anophelis NUHP1]